MSELFVILVLVLISGVLCTGNRPRVVGASAVALGGASLAARLQPWLTGFGWQENHAEGVALGIVGYVAAKDTLAFAWQRPPMLPYASTSSYAIKEYA